MKDSPFRFSHGRTLGVLAAVACVLVFVSCCWIPPSPQRVDPAASRAAVLPPELQSLPAPDIVPLEELAARFADADSVLVSDRTFVRYRADGTSTEVNDEYYTHLTEKGKRQAATRTYGFQAHYGRVDVLLAEIIRPNGERVSLDLGALCSVAIDSSQMGSNIYDPDSKRLSLSLPGLEIGDTTHIVTRRVTTKCRVPNTWCDYMVFESDDPVLEMRYLVAAPETLPLAAVRLRDAVSNSVSYSASPLPGGGTLHDWQVRDVPQAFPEPDMPALHTVVQRLLVSTVSDWRALSRWYWRLCEPRLAAVNDAMRAKVAELVADAPTREARIRRIFDFVSHEVRYMGLTTENEAPGYEPHDVNVTFNNRYGVCRDKAALLVAMLRLADIPAYPVLIYVGERKDPDVPQPYFNHAIVAVERTAEERDALAAAGAGDSPYALMDPTNENSHDLFPAYLYDMSYLVAHPDGDSLRDTGPAPVADNLVRIATKARLAADGTLTLAADVAFGGINDTVYRGHLARQRPEQRRMFFDGIVRSVLDGAALGELTISPDNLSDLETPLSVRLTAVARDYPTRGDGLFALPVPQVGDGIGYANFVLGKAGLEKRRFPLDTSPVCGIEETLDLEVAPELSFTPLLPADVAIASRGLLFERNAARRDGGAFHVETRLHIRSTRFSPDEYAELRGHLADREYADRERILLRGLSGSSPAPEPDAAPPPAGAPAAEKRCELLATTVRIGDEHTWTTTTESRTQILTYAGKKKNAELAIDYNPAWQDVELVRARVTGSDGAVHDVVSNEVNRMDAPWNAKAPRYPGGKRLVVALPAVDIGAVVETEVRATSREMPFFSQSCTFAASDPVDERRYTLFDPSNVVRTVHGTPGVANAATTADGGACWTATNIAAVPPEDRAPPYADLRPTLWLSSRDGWRDYFGELRARFDALSANQPAAEALARRLAAECGPGTNACTAIRNHVARFVRLAGPSFTELPLRCLSPADTTLNDGYGHSADVAILLLAMLRAAGFEAEPVLVASGAPLGTDAALNAQSYPQRGFYGAVRVLVTGVGTSGAASLESLAGAGDIAAAVPSGILLGDTDQYAALGSTASERLPYARLSGETGTVAAAPSRRSRTVRSYTLTLKADGDAHLAVEGVFTGSAAALFSRQYDELTPEERSRKHQERIADLAQLAVADGEPVAVTGSSPASLRYAATLPRYAVRTGDMLYLDLPKLAMRVFYPRSESRALPLYFGDHVESDTTLRVVLPENVRRIVAAPTALNLELPGVPGRAVVAVERKETPGGATELVFRATLVRDAGKVPSRRYAELLSINRQLLHPARSFLALELDQGK